MMDNKFSSRQVPVNNFSAAASVQIAIWWFIFGKSKSVFFFLPDVNRRKSPKVAEIYVRFQKKPELCVATDEMWPLR